MKKTWEIDPRSARDREKTAAELKEILGEESFFDLAPSTRYRDVRSETTLEKVGYRGLFHSVGMVCAGDARRPISIIIDLTHFTVDGSHQKERSALVATVAGNEAAALQKLGHIYGGHWTAHFAYDSKKKAFRAIE